MYYVKTARRSSPGRNSNYTHNKICPEYDLIIIIIIKVTNVFSRIIYTPRKKLLRRVLLFIYLFVFHWNKSPNYRHHRSHNRHPDDRNRRRHSHQEFREVQTRQQEPKCARFHRRFNRARSARRLRVLEYLHSPIPERTTE